MLLVPKTFPSRREAVISSPRLVIPATKTAIRRLRWRKVLSRV